MPDKDGMPTEEECKETQRQLNAPDLKAARCEFCGAAIIGSTAMAFITAQTQHWLESPACAKTVDESYERGKKKLGL